MTKRDIKYARNIYFALSTSLFFFFFDSRSNTHTHLHGNPNEDGLHGQLLQVCSSDISARTSNATENILQGCRYRSTVRNRDGLALTAAVVRHTPCVLLHGHRRGHAVEGLEPTAVLLHKISAALVVALFFFNLQYF
jgi:hypothetical protein